MSFPASSPRGIQNGFPLDAGDLGLVEGNALPLPPRKSAACRLTSRFSQRQRCSTQPPVGRATTKVQMNLCTWRSSQDLKDSALSASFRAHGVKNRGSGQERGHCSLGKNDLGSKVHLDLRWSDYDSEGWNGCWVLRTIIPLNWGILHVFNFLLVDRDLPLNWELW